MQIRLGIIGKVRKYRFEKANVNANAIANFIEVYKFVSRMEICDIIDPSPVNAICIPVGSPTMEKRLASTRQGCKQRNQWTTSIIAT